MAQVVSSPGLGPICAWTEASRKFAIHIQQEVIGRLATDAWVAFKKVPRRGLEIGGILLGHIECQDDTTSFWIKGFEPVESEHRLGPSYVLSESDVGHLQEALVKNGTASIGVYRSQTRSDQLELRDADDQLFQHSFVAVDALFLMLAAASRTAAFFVRTDGKLKCVHEFALSSSLSTILTVRRTQLELASTDAAPALTIDALEAPEPEETPKTSAPALLPAHADVHPVPTHVAEPRETPRPKETPVLPKRTLTQPGLRALALKKLAWKMKPWRRMPGEHWFLVIAIASLILSLTTSVLSISRRPVTAATAPTRHYLPLTVTREGPALRLVWDRTDSSLHGAIRTVLHIQDGNQQSDRNLAIDELSAGSILYQPKSADVAFRLDVYSVEPNASGSVQIVALPPLPSAPQPLRAQPKLKAASKQAARILPSIARIQTPSEDVVPAIAEPVKQETAEPPKREREKESAAVLPKSNAAGIIPENPEPPVQIADTRPSPRLPSPKASAVLERPASVSGARQEPSIWVSSEPAPGSRLGQVAARIPLVRRFKSTPKRRLSVYAAKPSLTAADKEELIQPVSVDVKVFVANSGKVTDAEIVRYGDPPSWKLADAALAASHRWTFEPASADDPQIVSELILHFRFSP